MKAPIPPNEQQRLAKLVSYQILDTPPEQDFDEITRLAAHICATPIALVSLVDEKRQWFKSRCGLAIPETPRDNAFCAHAIMDVVRVTEVPDALEDFRFDHNPLVTAPPHVRFYAGCPLVAGDGSAVGTLCVMDSVPRLLTPEQRVALVALGRQVIAHLELRSHLRELRRAERDLAESEAKHRAILMSTVDAIVTTGPDGIVQSVNAAGVRLFGYSASELIGNNVSMLMPSPHREAHDGYMARYLRTREAHIIGIGREVVARRKDGSTFPADLSVSEVSVGSGTVFTGIVRDLSERKRVDRMKDEFISTVSHELRTPLTSIRGSLGLVAGGALGELPGRAKQMIEIAHKNSERLVRLINDILDIEKIQAGRIEFRREALDLVTVIRRAVEANRSYAAEHGVSFAVEPALPKAMAVGDEDRLMQVMANLLSNAAKFSPKGERVVVTIRDGERGLRVEVTDVGPGIPEEFRPRMFEKFAQADGSDARQKGGTGLGLNITKAIVEQLGGTLGFDSTTGKGTTFWFELPRYVPKPASVPPSRPGGGRVLVCEDDADVALLLRMMFEQAGFAADVASTADEASRMARNDTYCAITVDIALPGRDGFALIRELRAVEKTRDIPVIVVSAKAGQGKASLEGAALGVVDWLDKPIDPIRLLRAVRANGRGAVVPRILHVEDDPDNREIVSSVLFDLADVQSAGSLEEARDLAERNDYDLVILDLELPDGRGESLLPLCHAGRPLPVIIFSAKDTPAEVSTRVSAAFLKTRATNDDLRQSILSVLRSGSKRWGIEA